MAATSSSAPRQLVAIDVGGTNARFAPATVADGRVIHLAEPTTFATASCAGLAEAWQAFGATVSDDLPRSAAIAVAGPVAGGEIRFTNSHWTIRPDSIAEELELDAHVLINDFAAVGHAVASMGEEHFCHLAGPDKPLPRRGSISIVGPGTGLGVTQLWRDGDAYRVQPTEGGHISFAPGDAVEDAILSHMRRLYRRVSVERVVSGPAIVGLVEAIAALDGRHVSPGDEVELWLGALSGADPLARAACERFCAILGGVAGDFALAHGAQATVIAGGLGLRLRERLIASDFAARYVDKGRFKGMLRELPVKLIIHPQPGLYGAAAAFAQAYRR